MAFVAGTLVHTDKGLVSIEKLQVGDRVLSRDENNPNGELAYKPIVNTFKSSEKQKIVMVEYHRKKDWVQTIVKDRNYIEPGYLYCTEGHSFWTNDFHNRGWMPALEFSLGERHLAGNKQRYYDRRIINYQGYEATAYIPYATELIKTSIDGVAVQLNHYNVDAADNGDGAIYAITDFRPDEPTLIVNVNISYDDVCYGYPDSVYHPMDKVKRLPDDPNDPSVKEFDNFKHFSDVPGASKRHDPRCDESAFFRATVYNIEVADYHTYFVGHDGIWVNAKG